MPAREIIIDGQTVPGRRFTVWAWTYFLVYVAVSSLAVGAGLDYALYTFLLS